MRQSNKQILEHIIPYCDLITESIQRFGDSYEVFCGDDFYRLGIGAAISQIGELAKGLSQDFRAGTNDVFHWKEIVGMRNHFAHGYEKMDTQTMWQTATEDIPLLRRQCEDFLEKVYQLEQEEAQEEEREREDGPEL